MRKTLPLAVSLLLSACAGVQLNEAKQENERLRVKDASLQVQIKRASDEAAAAAAAEADAVAKLADAQGKAADLDGKLAIANSSIESLTKSNKDLSDSIGAGKGDLGKLNAAIAEKDDFAKKLADAQKENLALERTKTVYRAARDKAQADLAKLQKSKDELDKRLADLERGKDQDRLKLEERAKQRHEDMGSIADAILKEIQDGKVATAEGGEGFTLTLSEPALFDEGSAKLRDAGAALLERVGAAVKALGAREVRVEGYTDNGPIKKGLLGGFDDHWALSSARAAAAARWLHEHAGLDPAHLSAVGFGEFHPVQPNDSEAGRAANRRIVVAVGPIAVP
ncbi:MAG: OmpA family protein [Elusimicrobiota bacterium]